MELWKLKIMGNTLATLLPYLGGNLAPLMNQEPNQKSYFSGNSNFTSATIWEKIYHSTGSNGVAVCFLPRNRKVPSSIPPATSIIFSKFFGHYGNDLMLLESITDAILHDRVLLVPGTPRFYGPLAPYRVQDAFPIMWIIKDVYGSVTVILLLRTFQLE